MNKDFLKIREQILKGMKLTFERLVKEKIANNQQLVISEGGKVVHVDPRRFKTGDK